MQLPGEGQPDLGVVPGAYTGRIVGLLPPHALKIDRSKLFSVKVSLLVLLAVSELDSLNVRCTGRTVRDSIEK